MGLQCHFHVVAYDKVGQPLVQAISLHSQLLTEGLKYTIHNSSVAHTGTSSSMTHLHSNTQIMASLCHSHKEICLEVSQYTKGLLHSSVMKLSTEQLIAAQPIDLSFLSTQPGPAQYYATISLSPPPAQHHLSRSAVVFSTLPCSSCMHPNPCKSSLPRLNLPTVHSYQ